ncbi:MAG: hypothetical protein GKR89_26325 [Candidatus Latescibacteria bacterium]|nr:hypothetical protein [Candidatus Latescibacterota bacterium]
MKIRWLGTWLLLAAAAGAVEFSGQVGTEGRLFLADPLDGRQHGNNISLYAQVELYRDWDDGAQRLALTPFVRWDQGDEERSHVDLRELYWRKSFARADLYVGLRKVFWGVTESLHLVDIVNQTDLVENFDGEDKLGQPMVQFTWLPDWGTVDLFLLPYFRERPFAGVEGRLRPGLVIDADAAVYEADGEEWNPDVALRWSHYMGPFDIGLAHFYGTGREPRMVPRFDSEQAVLVPHYDLLHQSSLDLQYTREGWLGKLEAVHRDGVEGRSQAFVAGLEYTLVGVFGTVIDWGLVGEYLYDNREAPFAPVGDGDIALGGRWVFNDIQDTNLLAFVSIDAADGSRFASVEAKRRLGGNGEIRIEGRFLTNVDSDNILAGLRRDDYVQVELVRYF